MCLTTSLSAFCIITAFTVTLRYPYSIGAVPLDLREVNASRIKNNTELFRTVTLREIDFNGDISIS
jgi:hypothetical protein